MATAESLLAPPGVRHLDRNLFRQVVVRYRELADDVLVEELPSVGRDGADGQLREIGRT